MLAVRRKSDCDKLTCLTAASVPRRRHGGSAVEHRRGRTRFRGYKIETQAKGDVISIIRPVAVCVVFRKKKRTLILYQAEEAPQPGYFICDCPSVGDPRIVHASEEYLRATGYNY